MISFDLANIAKDGVTEEAIAFWSIGRGKKIMLDFEKRLNSVVCRIGDEVFELSTEKAAALSGSSPCLRGGGLRPSR